MADRIEQIRKEAAEAIGAASTTAELEELRVRYLGRKAELTKILRGIAELPAERARARSARPATRPAASSSSCSRPRAPSWTRASSERGWRRTRSTSPCPASPPAPVGARNLLIRTQREIEDIFVGLGYRVMEGPEVELDYYNFTALNHPPGPPGADGAGHLLRRPGDACARTCGSPRTASELPPGPEDVVLRTHTSPMQVRAMEAQAPPIFIVVPGPLLPLATPSTPPTARSSIRSRGSRSARTSPSPT